LPFSFINIQIIFAIKDSRQEHFQTILPITTYRIDNITTFKANMPKNPILYASLPIRYHRKKLIALAIRQIKNELPYLAFEILATYFAKLINKTPPKAEPMIRPTIIIVIRALSII